MNANGTRTIQADAELVKQIKLIATERDINMPVVVNEAFEMYLRSVKEVK
jgi:hypothetical protein